MRRIGAARSVASMTTTDPTSAARLAGWHDTPARRAIEQFVDAALELPVEERVAVFDGAVA
jgi:hypothetical protein